MRTYRPSEMLLIAAAVLLLSVNASHAANFYVGVHGGLNVTHDGE